MTRSRRWLAAFAGAFVAVFALGAHAEGANMLARALAPHGGVVMWRAWDPDASPRDIAADWAKMAFTADSGFVTPVADMMMASREAVVDYMMSLGLNMIFGHGNHYGSAPWDELVVRYSRGVEEVRQMQETWSRKKAYVDPARFVLTAAFFKIQLREAEWWRDACLAYFDSFAKTPYPKGYAPPPKPLSHYEAMSFSNARR